MAGLSLQGIRKSYGKLEVLHGIDLDVADGEFVALVGPSGCGKSTLLRLLAGLDEVSDGEIWIGADVVNDRTPRERNIAMVFQSYALYPHMSVEQNIGFNLKLAGQRKDEIHARVMEAARMLDLEPLLQRRPSQLSGGQRQRVAMGRAIVRDPSIFLFDEPLSNLDAKLRVQMRSEIKSLHARLKTTLVYVTHDQIEAMTLADRIVVMREGIIEQVGAPLELYDHPRNIFVAGFLGSPSMNFLQAVRVSETDITVGSVALPLADGIDVAIGQPVVLGIRPEQLLLDPHGIPFEVDLVEPTGNETHIIGRLGGQRFVALFNDRIDVRPGNILSVAVKPGAGYVFDSSTGVRL